MSAYTYLSGQTVQRFCGFVCAFLCPCITLHEQNTRWLITELDWINYLQWQAAVCWSAQSLGCAEVLVRGGSLMAGTDRSLNSTGPTAVVGSTWDCWKTALHKRTHAGPVHVTKKAVLKKPNCVCVSLAKALQQLQTRLPCKYSWAAFWSVAPFLGGFVFVQAGEESLGAEPLPSPTNTTEGKLLAAENTARHEWTRFLWTSRSTEHFEKRTEICYPLIQLIRGGLGARQQICDSGNQNLKGKKQTNLV